MDDVRRLFNVLADRYDEWYEGPIGRVAFPMEVACLRPLLAGMPRPWLEVGVGTGRFAQALGIDVGIDPAEHPLHLAQQRGVAVVQGVGEALPFREASFGAVVLVVTLCFVQEPFRVLQEARRVLRDDGALIVGMVFADSPWGEFYRRKAAMGHPFYKAANFLSRSQTALLLAQAGFRLIAAQSTLRQPPCEEGLQWENPMEGDHPDAGFVGWKAVKD